MRFQTIHRYGVDVAHGLVLLFGIGTNAFPSWDSKTRWSDLLGGLAVRLADLAYKPCRRRRSHASSSPRRVATPTPAPSPRPAAPSSAPMTWWRRVERSTCSILRKP